MFPLTPDSILLPVEEATLPFGTFLKMLVDLVGLARLLNVLFDRGELQFSSASLSNKFFSENQDKKTVR